MGTGVRVRLVAAVIAASVALVLTSTSAASAQESSTDPYVGGVTTIAPDTAPPPLGDVAPQVQGVTVEAGDVGPASLPFTGGDVAGLVVLGVVAIAVGAGVLLVRRRAATLNAPA